MNLDTCAKCAREAPAKAATKQGWRFSPYAELFCPDHAPPRRPDTAEVKTLRGKLAGLRADRRESDDPTERELLAEQIEDLVDEIEQLRDDLDLLDFAEEGQR